MEKTYICRKHSNLQLVFKGGFASFSGGRFTTDDESLQKNIEAHRWYGSKVRLEEPQKSNPPEKGSKDGAAPSIPPEDIPRGAPPSDELAAALLRAKESLARHEIRASEKKFHRKNEMKYMSHKELDDIAAEWEVDFGDNKLLRRDKVAVLFDTMEQARKVLNDN